MRVIYLKASLSPFPATNLGTFFVLILIASPVFGFRPVLAVRLPTLNVPKPISVTVSFFFNASVIVVNTQSSAASASFFVQVTFDNSAIKSPLFIKDLLDNLLKLFNGRYSSAVE
jgi:hypothetical protein